MPRGDLNALFPEDSSSSDEDEFGERGPSDKDTIVAIVSGAQQGAVSIIRLSGELAVHIAMMVFRPAGTEKLSSKEKADWWPESHRVYYGHAVDLMGDVMDEVLLMAMLKPRSYTAEDVVEIHTHGGGISAQRVLERLMEIGARLARPGEFTMRAFLNGRLDLSQAESVAQLIDARTVAAADSALAGLQGGLGREITAMRQECVDLLVELDARLDFDEDLPPLDVPALVERINQLTQRLEAALATGRQGQLLRTGLQVALVGRPNVGKSSLLNALSGTERAIVTDIAGTTRDIVEAGIVIGGIPITLLDTAGMRESVDLVEQIGVERSLAAAKQADIAVMVVDAEAGWTPADDDIFQQMFGSSSSSSSSSSAAGSDSDSGLGGGWGSGDGGAAASSKRGAAPALLVLNKSDLAAKQRQQQTDGKKAQTGSKKAAGAGRGKKAGKAAAAADATAADTAVAAAAAAAGVPPAAAARFAAVVETSATKRQGMDSLQDAVLQLADAPQLARGGVAFAVNERQSEALINAREALQRLQLSIAAELPLDFWSIDLREAVLSLGEVSGDNVTEEVLDSIFSRFICPLLLAKAAAMVCKYDVRYLSDETALLLGSAVVGAYALQHLMAPHSAYETYWAPSQPYSVATTQYNGLGALSMAATTASVARLPGNRTAKKMLLKVTGASWLVFGLADLYYSRTGVNNNGGISAAINVSLGSYFLFKGFQPVADGKKSG